MIEPLTARELQILKRLSRGLSNREIADDLVLSQGTVKWYNKQIYQKLGVHNRTKAVDQARKAGLFEAERESEQTAGNSPENNLPANITPFIGRKKELKELSGLLNDPTSRLVNIFGLGGIGKTRLAIEAARALNDAYKNGVYFVDLAAVEIPDMVVISIAKAVNFNFQSRGQSEEQGESYLKQQLLEFLQNKRIMLVLDNLEQFSGGLQLISEILQSAEAVKILTTSRERLNLQGETLFTLGAMQIPETNHQDNLDVFRDHDAIQLFVKCAQRARPGFDLNSDNARDIVEICQLVGGLPLGIEMAAAWAELLTPEEIAAEIKTNLDFLSTHLHDIPERQRSIHSVFESSWQKLSGSERVVFQRLSVFRGGFTRRAAEKICGAALQDLINLAAKSFIKPDFNGRYFIHKLLRQYGDQKLRQAAENEQIRDKHLEFFLKFAEVAELKIQGGEQIKWINKLEVEHNNLRAALDWGQISGGKAESGLLLVGALERFWAVRCYFDEGRKYLSAALTRPEAEKRTGARAKALHAAGHLAYMQSDYNATLALLKESLSIYREIGPSGRRGLADALITLGDMESELGNYEKAASLMYEALDIMCDLNDERGIARAYWQLGQCAVRPGDYKRAAEYFEKALPLLNKLGEGSSTAIALSGLSEVAIRQGDFERAKKFEHESLKLRREIDEMWGIAISLANFGWIALRQGDLEQAASLLSESLKLRFEIGDKGGIAWCLEKFAEISLTLGNKKTPPRNLGDFQRSVKLFGAAHAIRAPMASAIDLVDQPAYEQHISALRDHLDVATFTANWNEGMAMNISAVVDLSQKLIK